MSIVMQYVDRLHEILDKNADQRTTDWFMMSSPFPTLFICLAYVYVVKVLGPKMMENRKPFQLKNALVVYNMLQMLFSAWLFYECLMGGWWGLYSFRCQPVDYTNNPTAIRVSSPSFVAHFSRWKMIDRHSNETEPNECHNEWRFYRRTVGQTALLCDKIVELFVQLR